MGNTTEATQAEKREFLVSYGFVIGLRDPRLNRNFAGAYMVVESHEDCELTTADGRNGPWCIIGDDLAELVDLAYDEWIGMVDN